MSSLSKLFWGGLRVGWIRGPEPLIARLARLKVVSDLSGSLLSQSVAVRVLHRAPSFPVTPDQLLMLEEDNTGDAGAFYTTFGLTPLPLAQGLRQVLG